MNVRTIVLWGILAVLMVFTSCQNPTGPETQITSVPTSVRGTVLRNDNLGPITNAIIYDIGGLARDTSKSDGSFRLVYQLLSQTKTRVIGSRAGFGNDTSAVTLNPGVDTTIVLRLRADSASPSGAVSTGKAANIVLISSSADNISIRGTGSNETALLQFEVRDSLGSPIAGVNKLTVNFSILGGPGGSEYVFPVSSETDPLTGRVTTRVSSGTKAGVLQVYASATVAGVPPLTIKSSPIKITISGGLPDESHFSISRKPLNIAGGVYDNLRAQVMVIVGDKEGNPVQQGTAVSFTTTGGVIQPNAVTDRDGIAQVELISSNPRPSNSVAIVTAKTIGDSGKVILKSTSVLFSGPTRILVPSSVVVVPDSGVASFQYRVQDPNGFPLAPGTSIALAVDGPGSGQLELSGDIAKTLDDTNDPSTTLFNATVRDKLLHGPAGAVTFKVTVSSPNGNVTLAFPGLVLADTGAAPPVITPGGSAKSGYISSLTLASIDNSEISVRGTGAAEISRLVFQARDSIGNAVDVLKRAYVTFSILPVGGLLMPDGTPGGEFLFSAGDSTDVGGQVSTTLNAGTAAGVVQVVARANQFGRVITSSPVRVTIAGGLPDAAHFTALLTPQNMPGWTNDLVAVGAVAVQVGDKFGNPVQPGTALYFTTSGGLVTASGKTDGAGHASATLYGGLPYPIDNGTPGVGHITIQTIGEGGAPIVKTIPFLFSGAPTITFPAYGSGTLPAIADGSFIDIDYYLRDANGNPLSAGNTATVTLTGAGASALSMSLNSSVTTTDTKLPADQQYKVRLSDPSQGSGIGGAFTMTITVAGPNGTATKSLTGFLQAPGVIGSGGTGRAKSILLRSTSATDISVKGTGSAETATLIFEARDSLGSPIDLAHSTLVTFNISAPDLGASLTIASAPTDGSGRVTTLVQSGTRSGVIQVQASTVIEGVTVTSLPVRLSINSGLPDQAHFTIGAERFNFAGLNFNGLTDNVTIQMGDKYSNPVQTGTVAYFSSTHGIVQTTGSTTSTDGFITKILYSANPRPAGANALVEGNGWTYVTATTAGPNGTVVKDSVHILWTGPPIIAFLSGPPANPNSFNIPKGGSDGPWTFTVMDQYNHPMTAGTQISASAVNGIVSGNVPQSLPDVQSGFTNYTVSLTNSEKAGGINPPVQSQLIVTVAHPVYGTYTLILASGIMQ